MNDKKIWIIIAAVSGFTAVAIGAFGAHGLKGRLSSEMIETYKTGVLYHLVHSITILAIALTDKVFGKIAMSFFLAGIFLFSFSLYFYSVMNERIFAMITPVGGVAFLLGWMSLVFAAVKNKNKSE